MGRGDQQDSFVEKFAPTVGVASVRVLAALACESDLFLGHVDITQAFIRAELDETIHMRMPRGCGVLSGMLVKLNKSLYGLRQASRQWFRHLKDCLLVLDFEQCLADPCVFRLMEGDAVVLTLVVHVDDVFVVGKQERCDRFALELNELVPAKNLGELEWYAGCHYQRDSRTGRLTISQKRLPEELAETYGVKAKHGRDVPLRTGVRLWDFDPEEEETRFPFRALIGSLMWIAMQTRVDIANAVRAVARYCASPKQIHWDAAIEILAYARKTSDFGISFQRGSVGGVSILSFADADYASKAADLRSVSGGVLMCAGGPVFWFSRTQKCVTLSTTEAEYVALADMVKEVLYGKGVWRFMLPGAPAPCMPVFEDNEGAIAIAENPISNSNSKHIDVRHHFLRELVERREISITHVASKFQHADFLTKALHKDLFEYHRNYAMNLVR